MVVSRNSDETDLIGHDHELSVTKITRILVVLIVLQTKNLLDILNFLVLHDLVVLRFPNVEQLATEREDAIVVATDDTESRYRKRLGRVSFCQDERAVSGLPRSSVVSIGQFRKSLESIIRLVAYISAALTMAHRLRPLPSVFFNSLSALRFAQLRISSMIEDFWTVIERVSTGHPVLQRNLPFFMKSSDSVGFVPNLLAGSVNCSFV